MQQALVLLLAIACASARRYPHKHQHHHQREKESDNERVQYLTTPELIQTHGYPVEIHQVKTADGYILTIHRIPRDPKCRTGKQRDTILLQHGLLGSSADWVIMGPGKSLAYLLSDNCHDVWMGNSRGNVYSRNHTRYPTDSEEFWDFSWHEMGVYDLPTTTEYIVSFTRSPITYIGHSQGVTSFLVYASTHPQPRTEINFVFALAPLAFLGNTTSIMLKMFSQFEGLFESLADTVGMHELKPTNEFISILAGNLCGSNHPVVQSICSNFAFVFLGYDGDQMNMTMLPEILAQVPAGASTKQIIHYAQLVNSGKFQMYDYGANDNMKLYGQRDPPEYPLQIIGNKISLMYGGNDALTATEDVDKLEKIIPHASKYQIPWPEWTHLDFLFGINAKQLVYDPIVLMVNHLAKKRALKGFTV